MPSITEFDTRAALMQAAADRMADALREGIAERGVACAALSGGGTPEPAYKALAAMPLDWSKITFALVDERFVPPSHGASNEAMLRRALAPALAAGATFAPMYAPSASVADAAERADALYTPLHIDIALMGMGADGHTASWFPDAPDLEQALDLASPSMVVAQFAAQAAGSPERLTLTRAALARAGHVLLLITGDEKRTRLESTLQQRDAPVAALFDEQMPQPDVLWAP